MALLRHPIKDPTRRKISQGFGTHPEWYKKFSYQGVPLRGHNGIDFSLPIGSEIQAVDDGTIAEAKMDAGGFGYHLRLVHSWGESLYAHLTEPSGSGTASRKPVKAGDAIGRSGNTGYSTGPHLHFGIRVKPFRVNDGWGGYSDPAAYLAALDQPDQEAIRHAVWKEAGFEYNPEASLAVHARTHNLGVPMTKEFDMGNLRVQGFAGGIVYAPVGRWDEITVIRW